MPDILVTFTKKVVGTPLHGVWITKSVRKIPDGWNMHSLSIASSAAFKNLGRIKFENGSIVEPDGSTELDFGGGNTATMELDSEYFHGYHMALTGEKGNSLSVECAFADETGATRQKQLAKLTLGPRPPDGTPSRDLVDGVFELT